MPRISPSLIRQAYAISPLLPVLLPSCRTLSSAINELRWIREYVQETENGQLSLRYRANELLKLCQRRGRGEPLQYILGSQPFGDLDIKCRPGVLIPRPETEAYTAYISQLLLGDDPEWLKSNLEKSDNKAQQNKLSILDIKFHYHDIFMPWRESSLPASYDIIISNPPYISQAGFMKEAARSVRHWEPKLALVPKRNLDLDCAPEDIFYYRLLELQRELESKILLMEVGDTAQAKRVATMAMRKMQHEQPSRLEIWRDWPTETDEADSTTNIAIDDQSIPIKGTGNVRAVVVFSHL
ncbi:hypothetical protein B7463_g9643, partial [Scytalidium lignicola]